MDFKALAKKVSDLEKKREEDKKDHKKLVTRFEDEIRVREKMQEKIEYHVNDMGSQIKNLKSTVRDVLLNAINQDIQPLLERMNITNKEFREDAIRTFEGEDKEPFGVVG